jgi:hypothetical protein
MELHIKKIIEKQIGTTKKRLILTLELSRWDKIAGDILEHKGSRWKFYAFAPRQNGASSGAEFRRQFRAGHREPSPSSRRIREHVAAIKT